MTWKKYPQNVHNQKNIHFSENPPKNIEIQKFDPKKCMKISEYPPWGCGITNQAAVWTKGPDLRHTSELLDLQDREANSRTGNHKSRRRFVIVVVTVDTTDDHVQRQKTLHVTHVVGNDISQKCVNQRIKRCMFFWIIIVRKYLF